MINQRFFFIIQILFHGCVTAIKDHSSIRLFTFLTWYVQIPSCMLGCIILHNEDAPLFCYTFSFLIRCVFTLHPTCPVISPAALQLPECRSFLRKSLSCLSVILITVRRNVSLRKFYLKKKACKTFFYCLHLFLLIQQRSRLLVCQELLK